MSYNNYANSDRTSIDWSIILVYLLLCIIGIFSIYSSVFEPEAQWFNFEMPYAKQLIFFGISVFIATVIIYTESTLFFHIGYIAFVLLILLTLGTFFFGAKVHGAQAWYKIGSFQMQPAEFAKLGTVLALSKFLGTYGVRLDSLKNYAITFLFILIPVGIVLAQNDTGSALVFLSLIFVLYRFGLPSIFLTIGFSFVLIFIFLMLTSRTEQILLLSPKILLTLIIFIILGIIGYYIRFNKKGIILISILFTIYTIFIFGVDLAYNQLKEYQKKRIELIFGLIEDKKDVGYNLWQSKVAIGSGQMVGKGFLNGTQTKLKFVPERSTDYIFCTYAEETGFLGSFAFILLYTFFLYKLVIMSERQNTRFARAYGYGVFSIFLFHFFINIGMTIGIVPTIGIPLPFISYGGSSLLAFTILLFIFIKLDGNRSNEVSVDID